MIGSWWWVSAELLVGVAASIKQPALLAAWAIPLVARPWRGWQPRELAVVLARQFIGTALATGTLLVVSFATGLGLGWTRTLSVPGSALTASPSTMLGFALRWLVGVLHLDTAGHDPMPWAHALGWVLVAALTLVMAMTTARRHPVAFVARSLLALAVGMPTLHTWYFPWGGVLLPLTRPGRRTQQLAVGGTVGLLCYAAVVLAWRTGHTSLGIACVLACCAVTGRRLRASDWTISLDAPPDADW